MACIDSKENIHRCRFKISHQKKGVGQCDQHTFFIRSGCCRFKISHQKKVLANVTNTLFLSDRVAVWIKFIISLTKAKRGCFPNNLKDTFTKILFASLSIKKPGVEMIPWLSCFIDLTDRKLLRLHSLPVCQVRLRYASADCI